MEFFDSSALLLLSAILSYFTEMWFSLWKKNQRDNVFESCVSLNLALLAVMLKCCVEICSLLRKPEAATHSWVTGRGCTKGLHVRWLEGFWVESQHFYWLQNPFFFIHVCFGFSWVVTCPQFPASSASAGYQIWAACSESNNFENCSIVRTGKT